MKPRKNLAFTIIFILSINWTPSVYSQNNFNEMLSDDNVGVISDSLSNMLYKYDEFEQSYVVFPKKKYLDEINSIGDVYWGIFNMMDRQNKGYSNQLVLVVEFELDEKFIVEEQSETIFVLDDERIKFPYWSEITENNSALIGFLLFELEDWTKIYTASNSKFRLYGRIFELPSYLKKIMLEMHDVVNQLIEKEFPSLKLEQSEEVSGYSPYELQWEGDIERAPMVQPLPTNVANAETVITVRFEVRPNGTVGRIIPLRKMNAELETEILRTLRLWRFNRLPNGVPQQPQWGTITFRFITE
jgi:hypothetical protein